MTVSRLVAIVAIFLATTAAWFTLGTSLVVRTGEHDARLAQEVALLWGGPHTQVAPRAWVEIPRERIDTVEERDAAGQVLHTRQVARTVVECLDAPLEQTRADVVFDLDHRRKGLLWYDTYGVSFRATYRFRNPEGSARTLVASFTFPSKQAIYDDFVVALNGQAAPGETDLSKGVTVRAPVGPGQEAVLAVSYRSRGLDWWKYSLGDDRVERVHDFQLVARTGFDRVDFPAGSMSPTTKVREGGGWLLTWRFADLVSGQAIGVDLPNRVNPGPLASRITFFAPVSLLFFLTVMVMLGVTSGESLHPMNYFFISAAFFAFHLLLAYLVDHVEVNVAFAVAAAASIALVVSYVRVLAGMRRALVRVAVAQLIFLVLFSYAFFFEGTTGLTITVGAVVTLFVLMQMTAHVDWGEVFAARRMPAAPTR
jgi:hypothetical protein